MINDTSTDCREGRGSHGTRGHGLHETVIELSLYLAGYLLNPARVTPIRDARPRPDRLTAVYSI